MDIQSVTVAIMSLVAGIGVFLIACKMMSILKNTKDRKDQFFARNMECSRRLQTRNKMSFFKAIAIDKMLFCENRQGDTKREISLSEKLGIFRGVGIF